MHVSIPARRITLISIPVALLIWGLFSWPLPRYILQGIPSSADNVEKGHVRRMLAGDHLQLHYFYWLFSDMAINKTPLCHDLYQFNSGNDSERLHIRNYDTPFTFVYTIGRFLGGRAFGWNITAFVALWLTYLLTWFILMQFTKQQCLAGLFAVLSVTLPYRWIVLLGGSPTGNAMLWVPTMIYGLFIAGRYDSRWGSLLAAVGLACSYWNDLHIFFFGILFVPVWYLLGFAGRDEYVWRSTRFWSSAIKSILPFAVVAAGIFVLALIVRMTAFTDTNMDAGRNIGEVAAFSPRSNGLTDWRGKGINGQIFIGYTIPLLLIAHVLFLLVDIVKHPRINIQKRLVTALIYAQVVFIVLLALGPHGPFDAVVFRFARKCIPGFNMIRQTGKAFAILPSLLSLLAMIASLDIVELLVHHKAQTPMNSPVSSGIVSNTFKRCALLAAIPLCIAVPVFKLQIRPTICVLDTQQDAYEAVMLDATSVTNPPRALAIPIWPGDCHWSSLYMHYASLYRIRMLNGYNPLVSNSYRTNVFERLESVNAGLLSKEQADWLLSCGINYILLHEDAFPEKVSSYPVVMTLSRLLNHPCLDLLRQGQNIWAFKIRTDARTVTPILTDSPMFPKVRIECEETAFTNAIVRDDITASAGQYVSVANGQSITARRPFLHMYADDPTLFLRARGFGSLLVTRCEDDRAPLSLRLSTNGWEWLRVPLPSHQEKTMPQFLVTNGNVDLDMFTLIGGRWSWPDIGQSVFFRGATFFHAGYTDLRDGSVVLRPEYEADSLVFFGPRLPFEAGQYDISLDFDSPSAPETLLGHWVITDTLGNSRPCSVLSSQISRTVFEHTNNLPLSMEFTYSRAAPIRIRGATFTRLK
ncbi:MAG: hypothetical protein JXN60_03790 [Lentisphaerae bacterium]|nr:hypothetical protein [Lentisphaerota bacterium]